MQKTLLIVAAVISTAVAEYGGEGHNEFGGGGHGYGGGGGGDDHGYDGGDHHIHTTHSVESKPHPVPVYEKIGVPIPHPVPVAVPHYVKVKIPQPYPVIVFVHLKLFHLKI